MGHRAFKQPTAEQMESAYGPPRSCSCGAQVGEPHGDMCDVEHCGRCHMQLGACECEEPLEEPWSGYWPGAAECLARGWTWPLPTGEQMPDLNRLAMFYATGQDHGVNAGHIATSPEGQ